MSEEKKSKRPTKVFRVGAVQVAAWENPGQFGPWYSFVVHRLYKDKKDHTWKRATTLGVNDLLAAAFLLQQAALWAASKRDDGPPSDATVVTSDDVVELSPEIPF